ncbi:cuticle protein 8 [Bemisia tabaci]|uniref:cuticle protein 8 n=1 Tax=Bemisia tabaci TaxID=7038 RepID=UPI0008F9B3EA|nr:PREDICTED: cuticle protein 8-like [Bemisia tabaci]
MYKIVAVSLALIAAVSCAPQYGHQQQSYGGHGYHQEPSYPSQPIKYEFKYSVHDPHTHDVHSQEESGDGHYVKGVYKLQEPYGGERTVHYSDEGHGFVAHVQTSKISHPQNYGHGGYGHQQPAKY